MNTNNVDIKDLEKQIKEFCEARDWDQFHNPKDLAIGMSTEANELLDIFRFKNDDDMKKILSDPEKKNKVEQELADILFFVLRFAQMNEIDLNQALEEKMQLNAIKYPVEKVKGSNKKYTEY